MADSSQVGRARGEGSRGSKVYHALVDRIRSGDLRPGARVREEEVATMLGVSRTPVREAFARLQARGLLENSSSGLAVSRLNRPQVIELYAMRAKLEGAAACFAAQNASPGELASLKYAAALFEAQDGTAEDIARANTLFHEAIYEAAHNRYLMRMLEDLNDSLALLPDTTFSAPGRVVAAKSEHGAILDAINKRDPAGAEKAACTHIDNALEGRLKLLFSIDAAAGEAKETA
jgi:DNA-binding GntR family transcriptional regulator